jgi:hypothetical protein
MKIIVKEANADRINAAIKEAEGRATARTITAKDVISAAEKITRRLDISKTALKGVSAHVDAWAQDFPRAYKYTPESTQFDLIHTGSGWALVNVDRDRTHGARDAAQIRLTDAARAAVLDKVCKMHTVEI